jgi:mortality factor 4-like protein 1
MAVYRLKKTSTLPVNTLLLCLSQKLTLCSWDDWVPEDRLRKLTPENRELANNLRHEMLAAQRAARAQPAPAKKKAQGSVRGSEERQSSVTAAPRGQKRVRDNDLEKV